MVSEKKKIDLFSVALSVMLVMILLYFASIYLHRLSDNSKVYSVGDEGAFLDYEIYPRGGKNDFWEKRLANDDVVYGKIYEVALNNYGSYDITDWKLRINILEDCWINNAWNGLVEIHQIRAGKEKIQLLNLLNYNDSDIEVIHTHESGDLFIELKQGDYIVYYPSKEIYEDPILKYNGHSYIGIIFYSKNSLANILKGQTQTTFHYNRTVKEGSDFSVLIFMVVVWFALLFVHTVRLAENQKKKDLENQIALEVAYEEANKANEAKTRFLASMSHEIRTPINAILGMNTMILRESNQPEILGYANDIQASGKTLLALINDILDLSKVESGKLEVFYAEYDISDVIINVVNMLEEKIKEKKLELKLDINEKLPSGLFGDEIRIKQVILNILNNAVKYTKEGSVLLKVDFEEYDSDEILLKVLVKDTGIGIKKEDIAKLFNPYERIEEERNKNIEGTGLGMSITKKLLKLMDSRLVVESEYGKGSEFSFEMRQKVKNKTPIGKITDPNIRRAHVVKKESFRAPKAKILVIDDVEMNLIVVQGLLKRIDCRVDTCESGMDAIKMAHDIKYDIIFIDHMMPTMDGVETLERIKKDCFINEATPKIVLTANAITGIKEEYIKLGFNDYLAKPVDGDALEKMIFNYLPQELIEMVNEEETSEAITLLARLKNVPDINFEHGLKYSGNEQIYEKILKLFSEAADDEDKLISTYVANKDFESYTVEVHGLKSSAKTIGAMKLADLALKLEMAGKNKDEATILEENDTLIKEHKRIADIIRNIL